MDLKINYSSKNKKSKKEKKFNLEFKDDKKTFEIILSFLVKIITSASFLKFVADIVNLIKNRSVYYFLNNSFFMEFDKYEYEIEWLNKK